MAKAVRKSTGDQLWLIPGQGTPRHELVADVAVRVRTQQLYSYSVPESLHAAMLPGVRVTVPYGSSRRKVQGWCLRVSEQPWDSTRAQVIDVVDPQPLLNDFLLTLAQWIAEYYACPAAAAIEAMLPAAIRKPPPKRPRKPKNLPAPPASIESPAYALTASQAHALTRLRSAIDRPDDAGAASAVAFRVFALFGVPGSGKTEVYIQAIQFAISQGKQAILLVPEIALATQVVDRLARRFERVAVIHSQCPDGERARGWRAIAAGEVDVVIGTRTAVFAPCRNLGLIVVDEEQEGSFKSLASPFYHARDVAIKRGQVERLPVVLGSATPSLETWWNARRLPHYELLRLPDRVPGATLPRARLVDARPALGRPGGVLAEDLILALRETLDRGGQAVLLHNRRGYSVQLACRRCGLRVNCARCGAGMVHHRAERQMKCHHCGARRDVPANCLDATCGGELAPSGLAIQRLEEELRNIVPRARIARLDRDTMKRRLDYAEALARFESREADILIGTQMVAKGLDFPAVRLVGVLDAESMLSLPDFRAAEHAFQLLVQVVGRAGRREGDSQALIQIAGPGSRVLELACTMDYERFAEEEIEIRRQLGYPPAGRLVRIVCLDERPGVAREASRALREQLCGIAGRVHAGIRVLEAEPCVQPRLREMQRWQVLVIAPREAGTARLLHEADKQKALRPRVRRITVDVDPIDMM